MIRTISAALLAVSVLAAPAIAATSGKTTQAQVTKSTSPAKSAQQKMNPLNANARMDRHHHARHHSHYRSHKKMVSGKAHKSSKLAARHGTRPARHG